MGSGGIDQQKESLALRQAEMYLRNKGLTSNNGPACPPKPSVCHPDKPTYGCSLFCRSCVDKVRHQGQRGIAKVFAEVEHANPSMGEAFRKDVVEKLGSITQYTRQPASNVAAIDTRKPTVREHTAKVAIVKGMDFQKTVEEIAPELPPADKAEVAQQLEHDPKLKKEIQSQLATRGLSDADRDYFVQRLWQMFESTDPRQEQKALTAMRILGKAFISEKVENTEIEKLQIVGLDEGIKRMQGDASAQDASGFGVENLHPAKLDIFDEETDAGE